MIDSRRIFFFLEFLFSFDSFFRINLLREKLEKNFRIFQPKWNFAREFQTCCQCVYWPMWAKGSFPSQRSPRIAARNVPVLSVFHRFMRSLNLHLYTLHSIRIHWNDVRAFFENTARLWSCESHPALSRTTLFSQKENERCETRRIRTTRGEFNKLR